MAMHKFGALLGFIKIKIIESLDKIVPLRKKEREKERNRWMLVEFMAEPAHV